MIRPRALVLFLLAGLTPAQEVFTPYHVARLQYVAAALMAPDGGAVAYVKVVPRRPFQDPDGPAWTELWLVTPDRRVRGYITGRVNVRSVRWLPDGSGLTYLARREGVKVTCLYKIPRDGGESVRLLKHRTAIGAYDVSPDGRHVAFLAPDPVPARVRELHKKGFNAEVYEENLRPVRVWIAPLDGKGKPRRLNLPGSAVGVVWSPRGDRLAVSLARSPLVDDRYMARKLHFVDPATGEILAKVANPGKLGAFRFSPDGRHLAFLSAADLHDPHAGRLVVVSAEGGKFRDLLPDLKEADVQDFAWQDRETLLYIRNQGCGTAFEEVSLAGDRKTIFPRGRVILLSLSLSRDGRAAAFVAETPRHPREVYYMRHGMEGPERLTDSNPWLQGLRLARQEVIRYRARDGLELEGVLIHPLERHGEERVPLIVCVHGGPEAHIRNGWLTRYAYPGQVGAARGFAVFYPNYRGSTGRGVAFAKLDHGDPAGKEFDDLVDGVEHLVRIGLVDRRRVGVTGGSYGGYAAAWCATFHTKHFAAAVMFAGISDKISKAGTTDIPNEIYLVHDRFRPWENWELALKRSPIYYAPQARTPILILHGKADPRVHPSQSLELYRYLKVIGKVPVRLVFYPGEGHGNRRAASRFDLSLRQLRWFEHYLKGPGGSPPPPEVDYRRHLGTATGG